MLNLFYITIKQNDKSLRVWLQQWDKLDSNST